MILKTPPGTNHSSTIPKGPPQGLYESARARRTHWTSHPKNPTNFSQVCPTTVYRDFPLIFQNFKLPLHQQIFTRLPLPRHHDILNTCTISKDSLWILKTHPGPIRLPHIPQGTSRIPTHLRDIQTAPRTSRYFPEAQKISRSHWAPIRPKVIHQNQTTFHDTQSFLGPGKSVYDL